MKKILVALFVLLFPLFVFAAKDPNILDVKGKVKNIMSGTKLFKVKEAEYDKRPELSQGTNVYTLTMIARRLGEGTLTFRKEATPASEKQDKNKLVPIYQTVTLKILKYTDKLKKMENESYISLHLKEAETIAVFEDQKLILSWLGDGWGTKGFHFYSYIEKPLK